MGKLIPIGVLVLFTVLSAAAHARIISPEEGEAISRQLSLSQASGVKMVLNQRISVPEIQGHTPVDLYATVLYHNDGRPRPTLLTASPYRREVWVMLYYGVLHHDYNFVAVDVRGTGESYGQWNVLGPEDGTDLAYVIDHWIPSQPWSDGKIGMFGASYQGENQIMAAGRIMLNPDGTPTHLKALGPLVSLADPYSDFMMKGGNCHWLGMLFFFGAVDILSMFPTSHLFDDITPPLEGKTNTQEILAILSDHLKNFPLHFCDWLGHPDTFLKSDLWKLRSTVLYWPGMPPEDGWSRPEGTHPIPQSLPVMDVAGWWCLLERGSLNNYQHGLMAHAPGDKALIVGPWYHIDAGAGLGLKGFFLTQHIALRWFDWKIKGKPDPFMVRFPVLLYVLGEERWRAEQDWPLPSTRVSRQTWYLSKQRPSRIPFDFFSYENRSNNYLLSEVDTAENYSGSDPVLHHDPTRLHGLVSRSAVRSMMGLQALIPHYLKYVLGVGDVQKMFWEDERKDEIGVPTFTTERLDRDVEITGPLKLTFWANTRFQPITDTQLQTALCFIENIFPNGVFPMLTDLIKGKDVQWVVEVNDVYPDGRARNMTSGWLASSHRPYNPLNPTEVDPAYVPFDPYYERSDVKPDMIRDDVLYQYVLEIWPTDAVFKKGHRIRVSISGSDFPHLLPFLAPSDSTIVIDKGHKATLEFAQANRNGEGVTWKWVDSVSSSIENRFDEANEYLLNHKN